jgi:hypothetical protein
MKPKSYLILLFCIVQNALLLAYEPLDPYLPVVYIHTNSVHEVEFPDLPVFYATESDFPFPSSSLLSFYSAASGGPLNEVEVDNNLLGITTGTEGAYMVDITYMDNGFPTILPINVIADNSMPTTGIIYMMPVELSRFELHATKDNVTIKWETASESNTDYFTIERSGDGRSFTEIGRRQAVGNSTAPSTYTFLDAPNINGNYYYRLVQSDRDGRTTYSQTKNVDFRGNKGPTHIPLKVRSNSIVANLPNSLSVSSFRITIADLLGRTASSQRISSSGGNMELDVSQLPSGSYVLVLDYDNQMLVGRFNKH